MFVGRLMGMGKLENIISEYVRCVNDPDYVQAKKIIKNEGVMREYIKGKFIEEGITELSVIKDGIVSTVSFKITQTTRVDVKEVKLDFGDKYDTVSDVWHIYTERESS